jgi:hypothetical protein
MTWRRFAPLALLALMACQPPSERLTQRHAYALEVVFHESLPGLSDRDRSTLHADYEAAIRSRLRAAYGEPASPAPVDCPVIRVEVDGLQLAAYPPSGGLFKGWLVDSTVSGVLDSLTRNRNAEAQQNGRNDSYLDRYIARKVETRRLDRLGYLPLLVKARLTYQDPERSYRRELDGEDLLTAFRPLNRLGGQDQAREIRAEEARVLAGAVVDQLAARSGWATRLDR